MLVRSDPRPPTNTVLQVPRALAHGVLPVGLTAPALRAFLILLAHTDPAGSIDMLKPLLVEQSGTRIDAAHRFLEPLRTTVIDVAADDEHLLNGAAWFDEIEYRQGERTKFAGIVAGVLSSVARDVLAQPHMAGSISIQVDEFRRLTTVGGILLYLRLRESMSKAPKGTITMRAKVTDLHGLFGCYCAAAAVASKAKSGDGDFRLSLSRVTAVLLRPAVADLGKALDHHAVDLVEGKAEGAGRGVKWRHVDIVASRLAPKRTLKDLVAGEKERKAHQARIGKTER